MYGPLGRNLSPVIADIFNSISSILIWPELWNIEYVTVMPKTLAPESPNECRKIIRVIRLAVGEGLRATEAQPIRRSEELRNYSFPGRHVRRNKEVITYQTSFLYTTFIKVYADLTGRWTEFAFRPKMIHLPTSVAFSADFPASLTFSIGHLISLFWEWPRRLVFDSLLWHLLMLWNLQPLQHDACTVTEKK